MPRKPYPRSADFPYHVTARCHGRRQFLNLPATWEVVSEELYFVSKAYSLEIHSFVLMPNHFHLIVRSPTLELSRAMNHFMPAVTRRVNEMTFRINQLWSARFHRCLIKSNRYYENAYKYVYRNPVEARLVNRVEDWPFSTLAGLIGRRSLFIPLREDETLFADPEMVLRWLNEEVAPSHWTAMGKALKKREFDIQSLHWTRAAFDLSEFRI